MSAAQGARRVTQYADARIRKHRAEGDGKELSFYGAMSEELSLELLASDDFLDVEVAAGRLAGMRSKRRFRRYSASPHKPRHAEWSTNIFALHRRP